VIGLVGVIAAALVARNLALTTAPVRQLAVTGVLLASLGLTFVLPADPDASLVPAALLWQFRVLSLATLALLWGTLGAVLGMLEQRAATSGQVRLPVHR